ncbi:MAG: glutathione S-transferase family protein [Steroidobacteraceae bacterium]
MLKLYGFPVSNYANMVQLALLEKGIPFEYVLTMPEQSPAFLGKSPRGKVPVLETPEGFLSETSVILEYLEETTTGRPLLPTGHYARAQVRSVMKEIELYIEWPARSCYVEAYFGGKTADAIKAKAREDLAAGFATLQRHAKFAPYVAGDEFTLADIVFLYSVDLAQGVAQKLFGIDLLAGVPGAVTLLERLNANPHAQLIARNREAASAQFIAAVQSKYGIRPG